MIVSLLRKRKITTNSQQSLHTRSKVVHVLFHDRPEAFQPQFSQSGKPRFGNVLNTRKLSSVGGTSTSFDQFMYLCPKKPEEVRRCFDLYCPIRKNYELAQKNEAECFQVLNMASLTEGLNGVNR